MQALRKKRYRPCFGYYLGGAAKIICIINLIQIPIGIIIISMATFELRTKLLEKNEAFADSTERVIIWIILWLVVPSVSILDLLLLKFYRSENLKGMSWWIIGSLINTTAFLSVYTYKSIRLGIKLANSVVLIGHYMYKYYTFWVVKCYVKEILERIESCNNNRNLTPEEIKQFEEGVPKDFPENHKSITVESTAIDESVFSRPVEPFSFDDADIIHTKYLRDNFEILREKLVIFENVVLGSGAYGKVYKGEYLEDNSTVAVKTTECTENLDVILFKALLSELKVMTYLGKHENVVSLIGACTAKIQQKKLYIVLEFCALGSLSDYLRGCRGLFQNFVEDGVLVKDSIDYYSNCHQVDAISTKDLLKWSYQTADGMAYLGSKNLVHGDLAARNLLLTSNKTIKISDFGLSRQLYQYTVYLKKQNTPLPWRWLAIESLVDMHFSILSDIWSYGVTVWEIFSLGKIPMEKEYLTLDLIKSLKKGMRLARPPNCTQEIYDTLIDCWHTDPHKRPSFNQLSLFFREIHNLLLLNSV